MTSTSSPAKFLPQLALTQAESGVFAALETAFGDTLWDVLRRYLALGGGAAQKLQEAAACAHWQEAVRQAKIIAALAHDLDFRGLMEAVGAFAAGVYDSKASAHSRRNGAQMVVMEFERSQLLIQTRYPGLVE